MSFLPERLPKQQLLPFETFYGFCNTPSDAVILIEACIKGTLRAFDGTRGAPIRSGSVIVFIEKKSGRSTRWTDGERWSPSRAFGPFLIYREVESIRVNNRTLEPNETNEPVISGLEAPFNKRMLKPNTRIIVDGLTKRTITMVGSDGIRYRVISYYFRSDVYHHFRVTPAPALKPGRAATSRLETPTKSRLLATFSRSAGYVGTADVVSQVERRTQNEQYEDSGSTSSKYGTPTGSDPMVTPKVGEILTQGKFEQESKRAGFGENLMVKQEGGGYQAITSQHMPSHYMPSQCTQSQYIPSQYIPRQYMSSQYIPSQHRQGQQQQILPDHHDRPKFTQRGQFRSSLTEDLHYHEGVPIAPSTGIAFRQSLLAIPKPPFQQQVSPLHLPQQGYAPQHATPQLLYNYPYPASSSTHYLPLPYHAMKEQQQHDHPGPIHYYTHTPDRHSMSPRHTTQCVSGHAPQTPCITAPTPTERQGMAEEEKGPAFVSHELAAMHTRAAFSF